MIPAAFDYTRPGTVDEAVAALAEEDAKVLAGGQSLIPLLRLRLAAPTVLVDLGGVEELRGVRDDGDELVIGAMTTYAALLRDPLVNRHAPLLAQATTTIGDRQVRHLGTLGGGLSHADPAGDLPAVAVALDATMEVAGPHGRRSVPAEQFFVDYLTTALAQDEVLAAVRVPKREGWSSHYEKFNRIAQAWAIVGVAAMVRRADGGIGEARVALTNMGPTPVRARAVEEALAGTADDGIADAVAAAAARAGEGTRPGDDLSASGEYRAHLARVLTERAVLRTVGMSDWAGPTGGQSHAA
jgi:aerobic carbon-monoxide dehydrogenase medium subunit